MVHGGAADNAAVQVTPPVLACGFQVIEQSLAIVEARLCETFPDDFFRRCAFSAFAVRALLEDAGVQAEIVGGHFGAFVLAADHSRLAIQGFEAGPERYPHLWVEAAGRLIDLGPHLLAFGSSYPVLPMPALAWDLSTPLPPAFHYRALAHFPADNKISRSKLLQIQCDDFVRQCRDHGGAVPRLSTWIATNTASVAAAAQRGDPWAIGAARFAQSAQFRPLPF